MSYSWYFRARCTVVSTDHEVLVYKVDYIVLGTLSSSLVLLNTRVVLLLKHFEP